MRDEKDVGVVLRDVPYDMIHAEPVEQLAEHGHGDAALGRYEFFVYWRCKGKQPCVGSHEGFQDVFHERVRKLHTVKRGAVHLYAYAGLDIHIFRQRPVVLPLNILYSIIGRCFLQMEVLAELVNIQLEHPSRACIVRNLKEDVHLLINVFYVLQGRERHVFQLLQTGNVIAVPEQHGVRRLAVAAGASRLLEVGFRGVRHIGMDHESDVRLVDSHSKGVGAHHHAGFAGFPVLLPFRPQDWSQPGVIEGGRYSRCRQRRSHLPGLVTAPDVDDSCAGNALAHGPYLAQLVLCMTDDVTQIGPLETGPQDIRLLELEVLHYVLCNQRRGGCREGNNGGVYA